MVFEAEIASEAEVPEGGFKTITWQGRPIILFKKEGKVYAYLDICTHVGGPLSYEKGTLYCKWHGSYFDPDTGKATKEPAPIGSELVPLPINVKEGKIYYVYPPSKDRGSWHIYP